jgi:hypothetical protein
VLLVAVGIGVGVGILFVAGCFATKISASRTEAILIHEGGGSWNRVRCTPFRGGGGYWDYTCRVQSTIASPFSFEVKVNRSGIVDQSGP